VDEQLFFPAKIQQNRKHPNKKVLPNLGGTFLHQKRFYTVCNNISRIFFPAAATDVPGPKIATTPASYRYW
jgi:hypothetical protein